MQNIRPFQIALLALFAIMGVVSVILLAGFEGFSGGTSNVYGEHVVIWGTFDDQRIDGVFTDIKRTDQAFSVVEYVEKDPRTIEDELVNAIAENRGPDVVLIPSELLVTLRPKIRPIPYGTVSEREFRDQYIDGASIFARQDGIYAMPLAVDPLVMFWNRDMFNVAGFSTPPAAWETVVGSIVPGIARVGFAGNIVTSAIAFGEYTNITHAKEMLLTLMMQSGSRLVEESQSGYEVLLDTPAISNARPPATAATQFYTNFSNANGTLYSWNRSLPNDRTAFLAGDLALYFGYASEVPSISAGNPNLNFDIAPVPQGADATVKRVYGTFYGLAIVRASDNAEGSFAAINRLLVNETAAALAENLTLVPVARTSIAEGNADPYRQVAYDVALIARGWLDPDPTATGEALRQLIDDIVSGRENIPAAVKDMLHRIELAF